jgi:hypothetical protein
VGGKRATEEGEGKGGRKKTGSRFSSSAPKNFQLLLGLLTVQTENIDLGNNYDYQPSRSEKSRFGTFFLFCPSKNYPPSLPLSFSPSLLFSFSPSLSLPPLFPPLLSPLEFYSGVQKLTFFFGE